MRLVEPSDFIKLAARHEQHLYFFVHELVSSSLLLPHSSATLAHSWNVQASNGGTLLDPLVEWCKSGLSFINQGVPDVPPPPSSSTASSKASHFTSESTRRAAVDYDQLLSALPDDQQGAVLAEARSLARWTRYRKAYSDICLRVDLLQVDNGGTKLDRDALYEQLLTQDRVVVDGLKDSEVGAKGTLDWAWFADADVNGVADGERRKVEKQRKEKGEELARKDAAAGQGLFRSISRVGGDAAVKTDMVSTGLRKQLPYPQVDATKRVLSEFLGAVKESLEAARKAHVR